jgi:hypothetical protein
MKFLDQHTDRRTVAKLADFAPRVIMYLCYGIGSHVNETLYSLLTAFRFVPPTTPGFQYVVYTDLPEVFSGLGVTTRLVAEEDLSRWLGSTGYIHRRKTMSIIDALSRSSGSVAFIDSDTYFLRSPEDLFDRIGPGRTCLHVLEEHLRRSKTETNAGVGALLASQPFYDQAGHQMRFPADPPVWNTGVLGIHSSDHRLMEDALSLTDQLWDKSHIHHVEQIATGLAFQNTRTSQCRDIVFHYWPDYLRAPFRQRLPALMKQLSREPMNLRPELAFNERPKAPLARRLKVDVLATLRKLSFPVSGTLRSA